MHIKILGEPDRAKRIQMHREVIEYTLHQALFGGIVERPRGIIINPRRIKSWDSRLAVTGDWRSPQFIEPGF
jgi:hypothetical protein